MELSSDLISQFVKATDDRDTQKKEVTVYGTIREDGERKYVQFDGSSEFTPIDTTVEVKAGDRVVVSVKNHRATVTGNLKDPSASGWRVDEMGNTVTNATVVIEGLSTGTTSIDGGCIKTGTIDAERLNLSGAIDFGDFNLDTQTRIEGVEQSVTDVTSTVTDMGNTVSDLESTVNDVSDTVYDWSYTYKGRTYIDGTRLMTGTVTASVLQGGAIELFDSNEDTAGSITLNQASSYDGPSVNISTGAVAILADGGAVYLEGAGGASVDIDDLAVFQCDIAPNRSNYSCGTSSLKWTDIYCQNAEIQTSDLKEKTDVNYDISRLDGVFDKLRPCSFRFIDGKRTHLGMIAQDVEQNLIDNEISTMEFAAFIKSPRENEEDVYDYGLRYTELIPMLVDQIHRLKARVDELESSIVKLTSGGTQQ